VVCQWCGVFNDRGNHQTLAECVEGLRREVELLRAVLAEREQAMERAAAPEQSNGKRKWKFRRG